ncbi:hypothetical protein [Cohnella fermenti]|uniref:Uncharacterized protein n=1 Tax=Cohnella fermenti TaxID=2565925 RepID=A0A4V3WGK0_9BACL|nr:hypothetical protein [Cohnella fermenti]THF84606.1 hypothetical protein E6C55_01090 [Cohnella fermenti]
MVKPFELSEQISTIHGQYLSPDTLLHSLLNSTDSEKKSIVRLWITEGIPYVFRNNPMIYEQVRTWLSAQLGINEKEITIIGSARTGYSLSSFPNYGAEYNSGSDLDFSIISMDLFEKLTGDFNCWISDYSNDKVNPKNDEEEKYWKLNKNGVPNQIKRGFIDHNKIPYKNTYPTAQNLGQTMYLLNERIRLTKNAPFTKKASIRIYKNWDSFIRQLMINIEFMLQSVNRDTIHSEKYLSEVGVSNSTFAEQKHLESMSL